jgi:hypothetical protein
MHDLLEASLLFYSSASLLWTPNILRWEGRPPYGVRA